MTKPLVLSGKRFGRLLVLNRVENNKFGQSRWAALCDCGASTICDGAKLMSGHTQSCGCLIVSTVRARSTIHGQGARQKRSRAYTAWKEMNRRVRRDPSYTKRGISVCERWRANFPAFYADMGDCPDGYELDRLDNSKGYTPDNCRWASEAIQSRNRAYCKLSEEKAAAIRSDSRTTKELMQIYGVGKATINKVKRGRSWMP